MGCGAYAHEHRENDSIAVRIGNGASCGEMRSGRAVEGRGVTGAEQLDLGDRTRRQRNSGPLWSSDIAERHADRLRWRRGTSA